MVEVYAADQAFEPIEVGFVFLDFESKLDPEWSKMLDGSLSEE